MTLTFTDLTVKGCHSASLGFVSQSLELRHGMVVNAFSLEENEVRGNVSPEMGHGITSVTFARLNNQYPIT